MLLQRNAILDIPSGPMIYDVCLPVEVVESAVDLRQGFSACRHLLASPAQTMDWDWMGTLGAAA